MSKSAADFTNQDPKVALDILQGLSATELKRHANAMDRIATAKKLFLELINDDLEQQSQFKKSARNERKTKTPNRKARIVNLGETDRMTARAYIREMTLSIGIQPFQVRDLRELAEKKRPGFNVARSAFYKAIQELVKSGQLEIHHEAPRRSG